jgi:hypothetical protein
MPFDEGLKIAEQGRRVVASNLRLHGALTTAAGWRRIHEGFVCNSGTMIGFVAPTEKLGEVIRSVEPPGIVRVSPMMPVQVFPVPKRYRGMSDCALVVEHPYYTVEHRGCESIVLAEAGHVEVVEEFPSVYGHYLIDPKHGIPHGKKIERRRDGFDWVYLSRVPVMVSPVRRGYYAAVDSVHGIEGRYIHLGCWFDCFGVVVEAPDILTDISTEQMKELIGKARAAVEKMNEIVFYKKLESFNVLFGVLQIVEGEGIVFCRTVERIKELIGKADAAVQEFSAIVLPDKLAPIRNLLEALQITEKAP